MLTNSTLEGLKVNAGYEVQRKDYGSKLRRGTRGRTQGKGEAQENGGSSAEKDKQPAGMRGRRQNKEAMLGRAPTATENEGIHRQISKGIRAKQETKN